MNDREVEPGPDEARVRIAVLDLGSTSFHLLVVDASHTGVLSRVDRQREMLRLGATLSDSGRIPEAVCEKAVATATSLRERAESFGAERLLPVATAALRDAVNGREVAARIGEALGNPVRLLSGREEARLIFTAFRHRVAFGESEALGIDLGGGSCELALGDAREVAWETTLRIGVTRLHRELVANDPIRKRERKALRRRVTDAVQEHRSTVLERAAELCIASGGTVRALARLASSEWGKHGAGGDAAVLSRGTLGALCERLVASSQDERLAMRGMKRDRADLLPTGAVILESLSDALEVREIVVCDWGLREGAVLESLGVVEPVS